LLFLSFFYYRRGGIWKFCGCRDVLRRDFRCRQVGTQRFHARNLRLLLRESFPAGPISDHPRPILSDGSGMTGVSVNLLTIAGGKMGIFGRWAVSGGCCHADEVFLPIALFRSNQNANSLALRHAMENGAVVDLSQRSMTKTVPCGPRQAWFECAVECHGGENRVLQRSFSFLDAGALRQRIGRPDSISLPQDHVDQIAAKQTSLAQP